eukprot:9361240-Pyramimonas_sp.AAC.1
MNALGSACKPAAMKRPSADVDSQGQGGTAAPSDETAPAPAAGRPAKVAKRPKAPAAPAAPAPAKPPAIPEPAATSASPAAVSCKAKPPTSRLVAPP